MSTSDPPSPTHPAASRGPASSHPERAPWLGPTARRIVVAILVTALLPFLVAVAVGKSTIDRLGALATQPELGEAFQDALGVYADLATAMKESMRHEARAIAGRPALGASATAGDREGLERELSRVVTEHPRVLGLEVVGPEGDRLAEQRRREAVPERERTLRVVEPIGPGGHVLSAELVIDASRFTEQERLAGFERAYRELVSARHDSYVERPFLMALVAVMALTIAIAFVAGAFVARPVALGVARLAAAMKTMAAGDLVTRVAFEAGDELSELGRVYNRTLDELSESRARVEFLRQMGEWQKVARRLAHEIKNPLTPIQLAMEECHRRYDGSDPDFARVLATSLEVVAEEVASLRRLVTRFSQFARLPEAELEPGDLGAFLREQAEHFALAEARTSSHDEDERLLGSIDLSFDLPEGPVPARFDREMVHRALVNLVRNAAQALRDAHRGAKPGERWGHVVVRLIDDEGVPALCVDDDGPGIAEADRASVFDPYVTTKADGSGLGLAIVKKIALDHGGTIRATGSPEGGARIVIRLPAHEGAEPAAA